MNESRPASQIAASHSPPWAIFLTFLRLGCTSFGGPIAHLGYFREEFVVRRKWLDDQTFTDIVGLCQFLPGPASSQVGFSIGLLRGGALGALAAYLRSQRISVPWFILSRTGRQGQLSRSSQSSFPVSFWSSAFCRSGTNCARTKRAERFLPV
jgi:hypothetical protein